MAGIEKDWAGHGFRRMYSPGDRWSAGFNWWRTPKYWELSFFLTREGISLSIGPVSMWFELWVL